MFATKWTLVIRPSDDKVLVEDMVACVILCPRYRILVWNGRDHESMILHCSLIIYVHGDRWTWREWQEVSQRLSLTMRSSLKCIRPKKKIVYIQLFPEERFKIEELIVSSTLALFASAYVLCVEQAQFRNVSAETNSHHLHIVVSFSQATSFPFP